ncbi:MAG: poly(A) polymerase [Bacteroidota bacterium]|nr:poly(A) polymerase [Bacteroidota bacterium]
MAQKILNNPAIKLIADYAKKNKTEVYLVGGYVRDTLLGFKSDDIDIMVTGDATEFAAEFAAHSGTELTAVYKKFGTALLNYEGYKIEFTSARKESYKRGSRKPKITRANLEEDLSRRDFTINAMATNLDKPEIIIDLFGGKKDLDDKIIRTPLDPDKTFFDDPLRILRAIRFASRLNFAIDQETLRGIESNRNRLTEDKVVSQERISKEFLMILSSEKPSIGLNLLYLTGVLEIIFPDAAKMAGVEQRQDYHHKDVLYHTFEVIDNVAAKSDNVWLRLAALLHDIAKPKTKKFVEGTGWTFHGHEELGAGMTKKFFNNFKLPLNHLPYVKKLVRLHLRPAVLAKDEVTDSAIRRLAAEAGAEIEDLLLLCRADITSKNMQKVRKYLDNFDSVEKKILEVQEKDNLRNFHSPVRGGEIMEICSLSPSPKVGTIKKKIEEAILEGIIKNDYDAALEYLYRIKDEILAMPD